MKTNPNKSKALKYAGMQFIKIGTPIFKSASKRASSNMKQSPFKNENSPNYDDSSNIKLEYMSRAKRSLPGLERSKERFTDDEISEIDNSFSLESIENTQFKMPSKLDQLKQTIQLKNRSSLYGYDFDIGVSGDPLSKEDDKRLRVSGIFKLSETPKDTLSRCDSLISVKGPEADDLIDVVDKKVQQAQLNTPDNDTYEPSLDLSLNKAELENQVWIYTHTSSSDMISNLSEEALLTARSLPNISKKDEISDNLPTLLTAQSKSKKNDSLFQRIYNPNTTQTKTINGVIDNGQINMSFNAGEKRLKKIIALSAPKETITPEFILPSIVNKSYCARKILSHLQDNKLYVPSFLRQEDS